MLQRGQSIFYENEICFDQQGNIMRKFRYHKIPNSFFVSIANKFMSVIALAFQREEKRSFGRRNAPAVNKQMFYHRIGISSTAERSAENSCYIFCEVVHQTLIYMNCHELNQIEKISVIRIY